MIFNLINENHFISIYLAYLGLSKRVKIPGRVGHKGGRPGILEPIFDFAERHMLMF